MARIFSLCALFLGLPFLSRADEPPTETVIRLHVQPMPAPKPALRYQLLPELGEMNPGNSVQEFTRCLSEMNRIFFKKEAFEKMSKWENMPIKDLPVKDMRDYANDASLLQADYAARLTSSDWQLLLKLKNVGIKDFYSWLPEVQEMRRLVWVLNVRLRVEIAECRFDNALITFKTMFALARVEGEHPTVLGELVGVAAATITVGSLEEMLDQPACPSLYWALTDLPCPFIDFRKGLQGEKVLNMRLFAQLDDKTPMNAVKLQSFVNEFQRIFLGPAAKEKKYNLVERLADRAKDKNYVHAARLRIVANGLSEGIVQQFAAPQVILLDEKFAVEKKLDEALKGMALPYWQAEAFFGTGTRNPDDSPIQFAVTGIYPKLQLAQAILDQRFALLRCVEALRLYAAENEGKLPARLDEIKLPLPVDPITGRSFPYKLEAGTAHLRGTPPRGDEKVARFNVRYEITIRK